MLSLFCVALLLVVQTVTTDQADNVQLTKDELLNNPRPFRMNKINMLWTKAKQRLKAADLPDLYSELKVQDRLEALLKKNTAEGLDDDGMLEAMVRKKFLDILNHYNLMSVAGESERKEENEIFKRQSKIKFMDALKKDKKLAKLWKKAESARFSDNELQTLREEFEHHLTKIEEYNQLKNEIDAVEGISENSIERFTDGRDSRKDLDEKHKNLKNIYRDVKRNYEHLEQLAAEQNPNKPMFRDTRVIELWDMAVKANFSEAELISFKGELEHFANRISKHEYFQKEAEISKVSLESAGVRNEDLEMQHEKIQEKVKNYANKVKKWYVELRSRVMSRGHIDL